MMSGVADIDSKGSRSDITVTHNTTWKLSTVPQTNTSLICSCGHNTKVCKCTTCQDIAKVAVTCLLCCVCAVPIQSELIHIRPNVKHVLYCNSYHRCLNVRMKYSSLNLQDAVLIQQPSNMMYSDWFLPVVMSSYKQAMKTRQGPTFCYITDSARSQGYTRSKSSEQVGKASAMNKI